MSADQIQKLIEADDVARAEEEAYHGSQTMRRNMWATGLLQQLLTRGYVVVPQPEWARLLAAATHRGDRIDRAHGPRRTA